MSAYIKLFFASNDVQLSEHPTTTNAITFTLRADLNEVGTAVRLYALANSGYAVSETEVTPTGTTGIKWELAPDAPGPAPGTWESYGDPLVLGAVGDSTKVYLWVRAKAVDTEEPVNDVTVTIVTSGKASAV
jgi:hypothetical protein